LVAKPVFSNVGVLSDGVHSVAVISSK